MTIQVNLVPLQVHLLNHLAIFHVGLTTHQLDIVDKLTLQVHLVHPKAIIKFM